jgi:hypothetical protein
MTLDILLTHPLFGLTAPDHQFGLDFSNDSNPKIFKAPLTWKDSEAKFPPDDDTEA